MAQSYKQPGRYLTLTAPYARASSGLGAKVGSIFGVSMDAVENAADGVFDTEGVHELTKVGSQAWSVGDKIYWDDSNKRCTTDATAGMLVGFCTTAVGSGAGEVLGEVKLCGLPELLEGAQAAVADLSGTLTGTANGSMVDIAATAAATAGGATPTAAQVDAGIATAVASIVTGTNEQLKELQTKVNALLAALRLNGVIAS